MNDKLQKITETHIEMNMDSGTTHDVRNEAEEARARFRIEQVKQDSLRNAVPTLEGAVTLRFDFGMDSQNITRTLVDDLVIGRNDPLSDEKPDIDLTDQGGYQLGISRRHVVFRLKDQRLEMIDLGSRNGTYLNGERLTAHQPAFVMTGDEVRLGKLQMQVWVNE